MSTTLVKPPSRGELEALTLPERIVLEDAFGEAHELIRALNDAEITRLASAGKTQQELADMAGVHQSTMSRRLQRLGIDPVSNRGRPRNMQPHISTEEVVDAEVVEDAPARRAVPMAERPAHYLPDVVSEDALTNLRTQALHWFEQGRVIDELLEDGVSAELRSKDDRVAIKREAAEMVRIARRLKGAV